MLDPCCGHGVDAVEPLNGLAPRDQEEPMRYWKFYAAALRERRHLTIVWIVPVLFYGYGCAVFDTTVN